MSEAFRQRALKELGLAPLWTLRARAGAGSGVELGAAAALNAASITSNEQGGAFGEVAQRPEPGGLSLEELHAAIAACQGCKGNASRRSELQGAADGGLQVLFVDGVAGEADLSGGERGRLLEHMLFALGLKRSQVAVTSLARCVAAVMDDATLTACAPYLSREIELLQPKYIVALGSDTTRLVEQYLKPTLPILTWSHPATVISDPLAKRGLWGSLRELRARLASSRSAV